jgi:MFS family permease
LGYKTESQSKVSSLTVGLEQLGSFIGAAVIYPLTNKYGRKLTILGSTALFIIGVIIQVIKTHSLAAWYIIAGLGMGGQSVVIPMYSAEMTPKEIRGRCGSFYQWLYAWGVFTAYWIDYVGLSSTISPNKDQRH